MLALVEVLQTLERLPCIAEEAYSEPSSPSCVFVHGSKTGDYRQGDASCLSPARRIFFLLCLHSDRVARLSRPRALRAGPPWRLRDECPDRPQLRLPLELRRLGASIAASLAPLGEEPLERFLRLALAALVATAFLVEMFLVTGCVESTAVMVNGRSSLCLLIADEKSLT
ncbi:hypothetical protein HPB51_026857 [Rhipicephalus microplus]|uniref:Uncharacterized protein n=1 Tax=Rhipicephalus microplus TaxID=6941 RepID=A0A9J6D1P4_RHIMP|nr:hypothetical protein HPB51_026857 [Rhipicephalus microplus]